MGKRRKKRKKKDVAMGNTSRCVHHYVICLPSSFTPPPDSSPLASSWQRGRQTDVAGHDSTVMLCISGHRALCYTV